MIVSCENCNKKFEISDDLIPAKGRILQCGSCMHKWDFIPNNKHEPVEKIQKNENIDADTIKTIQKRDLFNKKIIKKDKKIGFLSYLLVFLISFIGLIIVAETFEPLISLYVPSFNSYLLSLYESLKDIFLFFKDLIK